MTGLVGSVIPGGKNERIPPRNDTLDIRVSIRIVGVRRVGKGPPCFVCCVPEASLHVALERRILNHSRQAAEVSRAATVREVGPIWICSVRHQPDSGLDDRFSVVVEYHLIGRGDTVIACLLVVVGDVQIMNGRISAAARTRAPVHTQIQGLGIRKWAWGSRQGSGPKVSLDEREFRIPEVDEYLARSSIRVLPSLVPVEPLVRGAHDHQPLVQCSRPVRDQVPRPPSCGRFVCDR